jgi:hypothetical protein
LPTKSYEMLQHSLSAIPVQRFMGYMGNVNHALPRLNTAENWHRLSIFRDIFYIKLKKNCPTVKVSILVTNTWTDRERDGQIWPPYSASSFALWRMLTKVFHSNMCVSQHHLLKSSVGCHAMAIVQKIVIFVILAYRYSTMAKCNLYTQVNFGTLELRKGMMNVQGIRKSK